MIKFGRKKRDRVDHILVSVFNLTFRMLVNLNLIIQTFKSMRLYSLFHFQVQELHEEESQWVNYDEDELFVKMQLADGIFDALLKDTADVLTEIQEKKSKRTL